MARLKKSLALLLAIVMMFSSMSVAASATYGKDGINDNDIRFQVLFYREADVWVADEAGTDVNLAGEKGNWVKKWIETDRAAPGEDIEARIYLETTFPTATGSLGFAFNTDYFTQKHTAADNASNIDIPTNKSYPSSTNSYNLSSDAVWRKDAKKYTQNYNNMAIDYIVNVEGNPDFTIDYFDIYSLISASLNFGSNIGANLFTVSRDSNGKLTNSDAEWVMKFNLKVNSNEITTSTDKTVNNGGDALIPALYDSAERQSNGYMDGGVFVDAYQDDELFVNFYRYSLGSTNRGNGNNMSLWDAEFETISDSLTTITNLTFDANGGAWEGSGAIVKGPNAAIIGQPISVPEGTVARDGYTFKGWSTLDVDIVPENICKREDVVVPDDITDEDEKELYIDNYVDERVEAYISSIAIDTSTYTNPYDDTTYYALWKPDDPTDITYTINTYEMDVDGNYYLKDAQTEDATTLVGQTIPRQDGFVPDGFYIDETKSDKSVTITENSSSNVLDVYYARKDYTVVYNYEDSEGSQEEIYQYRKVVGQDGQEKKTPYYYGVAFPEFLADINGVVPAPEGYHFVGWSKTPVKAGDEENATLINLPATIDTAVDSEVDPEKRVYDLYAVYAENTYTYTFYAYAEEDATRTGTFADGSQIITKQFKFGDSTDDAKKVNLPSKPGYACEEWDTDIPATASGDLDFYPLYNQQHRNVEFWAILDDSGEYKKLDETEIGYGDTLNASHIPENYPTLNSWMLKDETVVNFPYTITEDTVLYLIEGKNVYPVDFYVDGVLYDTVPTIIDTEIKAPAEDPTIENGGLNAGYKFIRWDYSEGQIMDSTDGMRIDAIIEKKDITLTFVVGDNETTITGKFDEPIDTTKIPAIPEREGYEAGAWDSEVPAKFPAEDATYTAEWVAKKITLTFVDVVDNEETVYGTMTGDAESEIAEPQKNPDKKGHTFKGWKIENSDADVIETAPTTYPTKDTKYYAKWEISKYNYNIDLAGGNIDGNTEDITGTDVPFGTEVPLTAPVKEGNTFLGWANANAPTEEIVVSKDAESFVLEEDTNLKAVWSQDEYSVTFKSGADDAWVIDKDDIRHSSYTINVKYGDPIEAPSATRGDKYTQNGWKEETLNIAIPKEMPAKDLVFVAQWEKIPQEVEYEVYAVKEIPGTDGEYAAPVLVNTFTGTEGEKVEVYIDAPNAEFAAENTHDWSTLIDDESQVPDPDHAGNSAKIEALVDGGRNVITVYYKLASFDITFNAGEDAAWEGGATSETIEDQKYGYVIDIPDTNPKKTGHIFGGWEDANKDKLTDTTTVTGDATYTAIWTPEQHVAHFIVVDGDNNPIADIDEITVPYNFGDDIEAPAFTLPEKYKAGYNFTTWTIDPDTMGTEDLYYYATLVPVEYKVTYVVSGADVTAPADQPANVGDKVSVAKAPEKEGYTFAGWYDKASGKSYSSDGNGTLTMPASNVVLEGTYTGIEYTINIDSNGVGSDKSVGAVCGETVDSLPEPNENDIPEDTRFEGIFDEQGNKVELPFEMTPGDKNYSYGWSYKVSYEFTGAVPTPTPEKPDETYVMPGESVEIADAPAEVEGYTFLGWTIDGKAASDFTMDDEPVKIIGEWKINDPDEATISYAYTNAKPDGADDAYGSETVSVGDKIFVKALPEADGYEFDGWYADGVKYAGGKEITVSGDIAFTGKWLELYDITYKNEDGSDYEIIKDAGVAGSAVPAPEKGSPEKADHTFDGWVDSVTKQPVTSIPEGDVTLIPVFKPVVPGTYEVSYKYVGSVIPENADETLPEAHKVEAGKTATAAPVPKIPGYTFSGWYYNGEIVKTFTMPYSNVVLTGTWTKDAPKYTLTLDPAGGTLDGSDKVFTEEYEAKTAIPPVAKPKRDGFRFEGWFDDSGSIQAVPTTMPENDVKLTAKWTEVFDVIYLDANGEVYEEFPDAGAAGEKLPAPKVNPTMDDEHVFIKWVDAKTEEDVTSIPEGGVTLKPVFEEIVPNSSTITYEFTGDVPAGVKVPDAVQAEEGTQFTAATIENVEGYEFKGWTLDGVLTSSFVVPENDVILTGKWEVLKYDILLDANGGEFENGSPHFSESDVAYDSDLKDIIPASPEQDGYEFDCWVDAKTGEEYDIPAKMPAKDINVKATWKIKSYKINFNTMGGNTLDPITLQYKAPINEDELPVPVRNDFIFDGWTDAEGNDLPATMPAEDITAYAKWKPKESTVTYTLTVKADGGQFAGGKTEYTAELKEGDAVADFLTAPTVNKEGHTFAGWSGIPEDGKMPAAPLTVTAKWEKIVNKHSVSYYLASGDTTPIEVKEFAEGEEIVNPADPKLEGFTFVEWVDENGNKIPNVMGTEDINAYARFNINKYKLTYIVNGEVIYEDAEVLYKEDVYIPEDPVPSDPTMIFVGWNPSVVSPMPAKDMTYVAQFAPLQDDVYVAKFVSDGKTVGTQLLKAGQAIELPDEPTKFGFKFVGWEPEVPDVMPAQNMTFEAQWEVDKTFVGIAVGGTIIAGGAIAGAIVGGNIAAITGASIVGGVLVIGGIAALVKHTHTVTYMVDGEVYKTYKVVEGTKVPVPADPAKDGFKFEGWNPEVPEKMGNTDLVFEAEWSENAVSGSDDADIDVAIPDTGSVAGGLAAFAVISGAAAAAYVFARKKKED